MASSRLFTTLPPSHITLGLLMLYSSPVDGMLEEILGNVPAHGGPEGITIAPIFPSAVIVEEPRHIVAVFWAFLPHPGPQIVEES